GCVESKYLVNPNQIGKQPGRSIIVLGSDLHIVVECRATHVLGVEFRRIPDNLPHRRVEFTPKYARAGDRRIEDIRIVRVADELGNRNVLRSPGGVDLADIAASTVNAVIQTSFFVSGAYEDQLLALDYDAGWQHRLAPRF